MKKHIPDALLVVGGCSLSAGAALIYTPAGYIVGGILLLVAGIITSKAG